MVAVATVNRHGEGSSQMLRDEMLDGQADATDLGRVCGGGSGEGSPQVVGVAGVDESTTGKVVAAIDPGHPHPPNQCSKQGTRPFWGPGKGPGVRPMTPEVDLAPSHEAHWLMWNLP